MNNPILKTNYSRIQ